MNKNSWKLWVGLIVSLPLCSLAQNDLPGDGVFVSADGPRLFVLRLDTVNKNDHLTVYKIENGEWRDQRTIGGEFTRADGKLSLGDTVFAVEIVVDETGHRKKRLVQASGFEMDTTPGRAVRPYVRVWPR